MNPVHFGISYFTTPYAFIYKVFPSQLFLRSRLLKDMCTFKKAWANCILFYQDVDLTLHCNFNQRDGFSKLISWMIMNNSIRFVPHFQLYDRETVIMDDGMVKPVGLTKSNLS